MEMKRTKETLEARVRETPLLDRLKECRQRIGKMCSEGRPPRMCIPVQYDDDDFFICTTLADAQATVEALQAQLKTARYDAVRAFVRGEDKMCFVCGAKEPCELKDDPSSPCTFDPTPMELKQQVDALQLERDGLEAKCLEEHVTAEQAQAALDAERAQVQGLCTDICQIETQMEAAGITEYAVDGEPKSVFGQLDELIQQRDTYRQQLDAEREKVKVLHEITKVICTHCCEPMEIPSKAVLQTQLTQLQALVRALPVPEEGGFPIVEVDGDYYVNHTSRFSTKAEADSYTGLLTYRAALDATTPARWTAEEIEQAKRKAKELSKAIGWLDSTAKGGDGE